MRELFSDKLYIQDRITFISPPEKKDKKRFGPESKDPLQLNWPASNSSA